MRVRVLSQFMFTQLLNLHTEAETLDPETLSIWLRASRFPVVEPDVVHTKLAVAKKGLEVISRITNPVAVVAVSFPLCLLSFQYLDLRSYTPLQLSN